MLRAIYLQAIETSNGDPHLQYSYVVSLETHLLVLGIDMDVARQGPVAISDYRNGPVRLQVSESLGQPNGIVTWQARSGEVSVLETGTETAQITMQNLVLVVDRVASPQYNGPDEMVIERGNVEGQMKRSCRHYAPFPPTAPTTDPSIAAPAPGVLVLDEAFSSDFCREHAPLPLEP